VTEGEPPPATGQPWTKRLHQGTRGEGDGEIENGGVTRKERQKQFGSRRGIFEGDRKERKSPSQPMDTPNTVAIVGPRHVGAMLKLPRIPSEHPPSTPGLAQREVLTGTAGAERPAFPRQNPNVRLALRRRTKCPCLTGRSAPEPGRRDAKRGGSPVRPDARAGTDKKKKQTRKEEMGIEYAGRKGNIT